MEVLGLHFTEVRQGGMRYFYRVFMGTLSIVLIPHGTSWRAGFDGFDDAPHTSGHTPEDALRQLLNHPVCIDAREVLSVVTK